MPGLIGYMDKPGRFSILISEDYSAAFVRNIRSAA